MKRSLSLLLLILLLCGCQTAPAPLPEEDVPEETAAAAGLAGGLAAKPCAEEETVIPLPETESIFFCRWDGETLEEAWLFNEELQAFREALPEIRGRQQEGWAAPEEPWPVYAVSVSGQDGDYVAAYCAGAWADNLGNTLLAGPDPAPLWERFGQQAEETVFLFPAQRELALRGGSWDARFLTPAVHPEPSGQSPMTLTAENGGLSWTLQNQSAQALTCGNGSTAHLDVLLGKTWYTVPTLSGAHYSYTSEAYTVPPGEAFSGSLWQEPYGALPSGTYQLCFSWRTESGPAGTAAAPFRLQHGTFVPL